MKKIIIYVFLISIFFTTKIFAAQSTFTAGVYSAILNIPIGFPTAGYAQGTAEGEPGSPFVIKFPATRGIHTFIKAKVVYLKNKTNSLSIISLDTVGVDINMYRELKKKIDGVLGVNAKNHTLIISGTHTHAGPGRLARNPFFWVATDNYNQWLFESLLNQIFSVWQEATKKVTLAKIGFGSVDISEIINDRRCENPPLKDGLARFMRLDNIQGKPMAVIVNFGIHGTVLSGSNHYFSGDAPALIEYKIEEQFNYPVTALLIQRTAGDISPNSPTDFDNPWDKMENIGEIAAKKLVPVLLKTKTVAELNLKSQQINTALSREILGYKDNEFPYPYGAMLCGMAQSHCDEDYKTPIEDMKKCPIAGEKFAMPETMLTAVKINDWLILTLPGEPTTSLGKQLTETIAKELKTNNVMLFGYSQDHLGYLLLSWDWWQGGYEPSMSPWGWKLGEFLIEKSFELGETVSADKPLPKVTAPTPKVYKEKTAKPPTPEVAKDFGKIVAEIKNENNEIKFSWYGGDASVDLPQVFVEEKVGNNWKKVLQKNGIPLTVSHYSTFLNYTAVPNYKEQPTAEARQFKWEIVWRYKRPVTSTLIIKSGLYRFNISGKAFSNGKVKNYNLVSGKVKI